MRKPPDVPWDSELRTRRVVEELPGKFRDISPEEWEQFEWYNVTCYDSPLDAHVFVKIGKRHA